MQLTHVQWSPDGKVILFGNAKGEISIYDSHGTYNCKLAVHCLLGVTGLVKLAALEWYNGREGYVRPNCPCLVVAFDNGRAQIMRHELDDSPVVIESVMTLITSVSWNHNGSLVAFTGHQRLPEGKEICVVQFYNCDRQLLHSLKVPGRSLCAASWEGNGLRIALGVGSFIYFANIRHSYKWGYFSDTLVYAFRKPDKLEDCVIFWNTVTDEKYAKTVAGLSTIACCKDYCVLVTTDGDSPGQATLLLCNALGTPIESRYLEMEPSCVSVSQTHIVAANASAVYVWHYRTPSRLAAPELTNVASRRGWEGQERLIHADDHPDDTTEAAIDFKKASTPIEDPICAVCATEKSMIVARTSGVLQRYSLPRLALESRHKAECRPHRITLNSTSSKVAIIDTAGVLSLYDLDKKQPGGALGERLALERRDVWDIRWAEDNPDLFAIMEKTRMYIFRGIDPEEPVVSSGHLCVFREMQVKSILLDEVMKDPESPSEDLVHNLDIKSLRDTRDLLQKVGIQDAHQFIEDNPHPRLWRLLAESSLEKLELEMAEKAFVCSGDYQGIQFVKRLKKLDSEVKQSAEVEAYFRKFDVAEKSYLDIDRRDLAVDLRVKLGDWFRVVQLLKTGGGAGDDILLTQAWNAIGDYYADRQKWQHAVTYYSQGSNHERLADCYYTLEDYSSLEKLADSLPDNHSLLTGLAQMFVSVGMCEQAVSAYIKVSKLKEAIDCCVELNQWDQAVELAKKHNVKEIDSLLVKYATHLLEKDKILNAVELYRKANHFIEAAKLLTEAAKQASRQSLSPLKIKKIYVLAALLVECHQAHRKKVQQQKAVGDGTTGGSKKGDVMSTLQGLLTEDFSSASEITLLDKAWRGAEAYHFFLLAQKQFYTGLAEPSLRTALCLRDYEDIIPEVEIYSLLALCSSACCAFGVCSKTLIKLESLKELTEEQQQQYESVSMEIFTRHSPKDVVTNEMDCPHCSTVINDWSAACPSCDSRFPTCVATGQPLLDTNSWLCPTCKHRAALHEASALRNCPLCHSPIQ